LWGQNKTISVFDFTSNVLKSNEKALEIDHSTEVKKTFNNYIKMLNDDDAQNISQFFYFERNMANNYSSLIIQCWIFQVIKIKLE
jgi:serine/threonine-protein kinase RIO1